MIRRRTLLTGLLAAPLVVRDCSVLMPVRQIIPPFMYLHMVLPGTGHWRKHWCHRDHLPEIMRHFPNGRIVQLEYRWHG